jgi:hypothetical protein
MGGNHNGWLTNASALPQWLQYQYTAGKTAIAYGFRPWFVDNFPSRTPTAWTFQGSNDGSSWTTLDTRSGFSATDSAASYIWTISAPATYSYYRFNVTANGGNAYSGVGRFYIYTTEDPQTGFQTIDNTTIFSAADPTTITVIKDAVWKPTATPVYADEFNDASLDANWTRVYPTGASGYTTWTELGDSLSVAHTANADGNGTMHSMLRPIGTSFVAGDAIMMAYRIAAPYATNYTMIGIGVSTGLTFGTHNILQAQIYHTTTIAGPGVHRINVNLGMNADSSYSSGRNINVTGGPVWLRLVMTSANNWRADYSPDGISWVLGDTMAYTLTPTHMGLMCSSWTTAVPFAVSYENFRRVSGVS